MAKQAPNVSLKQPKPRCTSTAALGSKQPTAFFGIGGRAFESEAG